VSCRHRAVVVLIAVSAAVAAAGGAPAPAGAKGVVGLSVCGPAGCVERTKAATRHVEADRFLAGWPAKPPRRRERFVRLRLAIGEEPGAEAFGWVTQRFLPRSGLLVGEDGMWTRPQPPVLRALRRVSRGVGRFPARRLRLTAPPPAADPAAAETPVPTMAPAPRIVTRAGVGDGPDAGLVAGGIAALGLAVAGTVLAWRRRRV
jgi:hypothetical protein